MIRIFSKDRKELHSDIDTWIVKWTTYKCEFLSSIQYPKVVECHKAFTNKDEAREYAKTLNDAMKLIDRFEYLLVLNKEDKEFCGTLKDAIENIKEYHKID